MIFLLTKDLVEPYEEVEDAIICWSTNLKDILKHLTHDKRDYLQIIFLKEDSFEKESLHVSVDMAEWFLMYPLRFNGYDENDRIYYLLKNWCDAAKKKIEEEKELKKREFESKERAEYERLKAKFENS